MAATTGTGSAAEARLDPALELKAGLVNAWEVLATKARRAARRYMFNLDLAKRKKRGAFNNQTKQSTCIVGRTKSYETSRFQNHDSLVETSVSQL